MTNGLQSTLQLHIAATILSRTVSKQAKKTSTVACLNFKSSRWEIATRPAPPPHPPRHQQLL